MPAPPSAPPCVLVIADPERVAELVGALSEPLPTAVVSKIDVLSSSGGDEALERFEARRPHVVVVTATLETGDTAALVEAVRGAEPRAEVGIVVIGDPEGGPVRHAIDAIELAPDRFVSRPMAPRTLRFAVASALEAVMLARGSEDPGAALPPPLPPVPAPPARAEAAPAIAAPAPAPAAPAAAPAPDGQEDATRAALRRRWAALADSMADSADDDDADADDAADAPSEEAAPPPPSDAPPEVPAREPTLIIRDPSERAGPPEAPPPPASSRPGDGEVGTPAKRRSAPMPLVALLDRSPAPVPALAPEPEPDPAELVQPPLREDLGLPFTSFGDELVVGGSPRGAGLRLEVLDALPDEAPPAPSSSEDGRDFARQLRAKMSQMAQRLFQGADTPAPAPADLAPRHDHSTEIDLSALGEEPPLGGVPELEARGGARSAIAPGLVMSPGSWDSQVRERGLPEQGEIVRGVSDAAMLLAKMFAGGSTGRIAFRRGEGETVVFFDQGRPVFASSSEARDRMGELLVREGKITAAQYERCQSVVAESGRRMGEILVDLGYLKRRELLPAVRRHVEDLVYALFGWDDGRYQISIEAQPCAERIRLSRHPAALILEGVRRKLNRSTLERLIGPPSTVIEVGDRERLGGIVNLGDLTAEERAALAAFDGQADLTLVAHAAGVDVADVLPLAWGLCVLGLAAARRTDEAEGEATAPVGETDLAIDRERVRARWKLVTDADYFALLGVRRDATAFEIRRAYQAARRDFAADGFPGELRRELARELDDIASVLDEAFHVLRDDRLRQTYLANLIE